jgi:hypothetical protein
MEQRARTLAQQGQALQEVEQLRESWLEQTGGNLLAVAALTLAHWTAWASRRAKWHREKAFSSGMATFDAAIRSMRRRLPVRQLNQERRWYELKDQALRLLARTSWLEIHWYQPNRLWIDELCSSHYREWCEERTYTHSSFGDFVVQHEEDLLRCSQCKRDLTHYALYSVELRPPSLPGKSCYRFHVPYSIGKTYLPRPEHLSHVAEHEASEGLFRFGRPLEGEESKAYSAPFLERHLTSALEELGRLLNGETVHAIPVASVTSDELP